MLTAVALGLVFGLRHAFDPDHVVAVSTMAARHRSPWKISSIGLSWGIGHSVTLLAVGALIVGARSSIPNGIAESAEIAVGALMIALGIANLTRRARSANGRRWKGAAARSGVIGLAHGLAGSGAIVLVAVAALPTPGAAIAHLVAFAFGSLFAMVGFSFALGTSLAAFGATDRTRALLTTSTGILSIAVGLGLIYGFDALAASSAAG